MSTLRQALATPLNLARQVDEEIEQRLQTLINRGELAAEEGRRLRDELLALGARSRGRALPDQQDVERILDERGVPTQNDLQKIAQQLDTLVTKLNELTPDSESS
jgi:polyhydroxyalkanoate synthesis regulator phasin